MSKAMHRILVVFVLFATLLSQGCSANNEVDKIKIAYIMDPEGRTSSDNLDVLQAFEEIKSYYDFEYNVFTTKDNDDVEKQVISCYSSDYDLIIGASYVVNHALLENKVDYPNINIALIGENDETSVSMSIDFKMEESSFLAGVLAASKTTTGVIGYVGAYSDDLTNYEIGYYAGAKTVNPNITIVSNYTNSYNNVTNGYTLTNQQISNGADIIYSNCGASGLGVANAINEHDNVLLIDSDLYQTVNDQILLGTVTKDYKKAALYLIDSFINDNFIESTTRCGIAYDMVDFSCTDLASEENIALLNEYRSQIRQFAVPIPDTWGNYNNFNYYSYINTTN